MRVTPFAWAAGAAAIGGIASSVIGSNAAGDAAQTQADAATQASQTQAAAADKATQAQLDMFNKTQANELPFLQSGTNALPFLQSGLGLTDGSGVGALNAPYTGAMPTTNPAMAPFTADMFHNSPGYQFQMQQGENAVLNNRSALGGVNSGNTLKALTQFGQGTANQDYWNAYNAYVNNYQANASNNTNNNNVLQANYANYTNTQNQKFNQLQTLTGSGQNAAASLGALGANTASNIGSIGTNAATQIGNNMIGAGNASAAGQVGSANAISSGINNLTGGLSQNYLLYSLLNNGSLGGQSSGVWNETPLNMVP